MMKTYLVFFNLNKETGCHFSITFYAHTKVHKQEVLFFFFSWQKPHYKRLKIKYGSYVRRGTLTLLKIRRDSLVFMKVRESFLISEGVLIIHLFSFFGK